MQRDLNTTVHPFVPEQIEDVEGSSCVIIAADCVARDKLVDLCENVQNICGESIPIILIADEPASKLFLHPTDRLRVRNVIRVDVEEGGVPGDTSPEEKLIKSLGSPRQDMYDLFLETIRKAL